MTDRTETHKADDTTEKNAGTVSSCNRRADADSYRHSKRVNILHEIGLRHEPRCYYQNRRLIIAMLAAALLIWGFHDLAPVFSTQVVFSWMQLLSLVIWQPLVEELLFRGIIQGQLIKRDWGKRAWLGLSAANVVTSVLFVTIHMLHSSVFFALTIMLPSLVFGYFRDYCNSLYPSILLHVTYNLMVFIALILHGNMPIPVL